MRYRHPSREPHIICVADFFFFTFMPVKILVFKFVSLLYTCKTFLSFFLFFLFLCSFCLLLFFVSAQYNIHVGNENGNGNKILKKKKVFLLVTIKQLSLIKISL